MSLLLSQASSYTESVSSKKNPRMQSTFDNIQRECEQFTGYNKKGNEGFEDHNKKQTEREETVQKLLNKSQSQTQDDSGLANYSNKIENSPSLPNFLMPPKTIDTFQNPAYTSSSKGGSNYTESYAATPYYKGLSGGGGGGTSVTPPTPQLMEKLNYMIRLLEEQQKEPTQNIMEEFVLYGLLGVFMIYLVDSFARAGKYIR